jgi:nitroreductase
VDALDAIITARSMRWLKPDPVDSSLVAAVLGAATCAPSPHNCQPWRFLVVRDAAVRASCGQAVARAAESSGLAARVAGFDPDHRRAAGIGHLAASLGDAPIIIMACGVSLYPPGQPDDYFMHTSVHAACQNLLIAARAVGLGAALTMLHRLAEPELRAILRVPDDVSLIATIALGWPARRPGPVARRPLSEVTHVDHWQHGG